MARRPSAAMLVIGDEVLSGRTRDANGHHLARRLTESGVALRQIRVVPDEAETIAAAVRELRAAHDMVFTSGGIGPTHDDITADAVAAAFGVGIDVREDAREALIRHYGDASHLNEARLRMARIPEGAALIENPVSGAPGFTIGNVHVMAGVPRIFEAMLESVLAGVTGGPPLLSRSFRVPAPEGEIAGPLARIAENFPGLSFGSYPYHFGGHGSIIVARGEDGEALERAARAIEAMARDLGVEAEETAA